MPTSHRELFQRWIEAFPSLSGVKACGIGFPDRTAVTRSFWDGFPEVALGAAWRCIGDVFQVLRSQRLPSRRVDWKFENHVLHCVQRPDGTFFVLFVARPPAHIDTRAIDKALAQFLEA